MLGGRFSKEMTMRFLRLMFATLLLSFAATQALAQQQVVYHFDDAPAGVVRLARLQGQGFAYIKP